MFKRKWMIFVKLNIYSTKLDEYTTKKKKKRDKITLKIIRNISSVIKLLNFFFFIFSR